MTTKNLFQILVNIQNNVVNQIKEGKIDEEEVSQKHQFKGIILNKA